MAANHLVDEKSPYLRQHAYNPVDWYPWGAEALGRAQREDKPIFLSIGYSTCHWCHVMEHESFENEDIAGLLNRYFVPVKVDREERPDLDRIYMAYVQAATGSGGWPMSVWLTPDGKPFVGGTYFPPEDRYGRPGFSSVLERIAAAWRDDRGRIVESSARVLAEMAKRSRETGSGDTEIGPDSLDRAFSLWRRSFDANLGGFGSAPKFPRPAVLEFLLRYHARTANAEALDMVTKTLTAMSHGGMNDQLGGGFHRYSVDEYWFVPHFEKMLYDQAQIATSLVECFQITKDLRFAEEARRVLDYVLRDMTSPEGGFYSAEDADSVIDPAEPKKKGEGAFYIFDAREIEALAGERNARFFNYRYGAEERGNVHNDPHGEFTGRNILFQAHTIEETSHHFEISVEEVTRAIDDTSRKLLEARAGRVRPHLDDKILTAWNGLMISAFAKAGVVLEEPRYADAARQSAAFIRGRMWDASEKTLLRRYRDNDAAIPGFLDDYAFLAGGLVDLYEAQFKIADLEWAIDLTDRMMELFEDKEGGAFFSTTDAPGGEKLLLRMKDDYDGAEPSGNSVAALNLFRLERMTGSAHLGEAARRTLRAFANRIETQPYGVPLMMCALDFSLSAPRQVVIAGEPDAELSRVIHARFDPNLVILLAHGDAKTALTRWSESIGGMTPVNGKTAAYVCENFTCRLPVTEAGELLRLLQ